MKKIIVILALILIIVLLLSACGNKQIFDFNYTFDYAIINLPNGEVVEGEVQSWTDYEEGDQLQIKINNTMYLVHSMNVALLYRGGN